MMEKKKVLCDTNIWYYLAEGKVELNKTHYKYYASTANVIDFLASDKLNDPTEKGNKLKKAVLAMTNQADDFFILDPTTEARRRIYNIDISDIEISGCIENYEQLIRYARGEVSGLYGPTIESVKETKRNFQFFAYNFKAQLIVLFTKKYKNIEEKKGIIKGNILRWLNNDWEALNGIATNLDLVDFSTISIFYDSFCEYLEDVKTDSIPNGNSLIDFFQLLYINGEDYLFWTREKRVISKINRGHSPDKVKNILYSE